MKDIHIRVSDDIYATIANTAASERRSIAQLCSLTIERAFVVKPLIVPVGMSSVPGGLSESDSDGGLMFPKDGKIGRIKR